MHLAYLPCAIVPLKPNELIRAENISTDSECSEWLSPLSPIHALASVSAGIQNDVVCESKDISDTRCIFNLGFADELVSCYRARAFPCHKDKDLCMRSYALAVIRPQVNGTTNTEERPAPAAHASR